MELLSKLNKVYGLTTRQSEILHLISKGLTNKEIADQLYISHNTVKIHTKSLFKQLEVSNRIEAAMLFKKYEDEVGGKSPNEKECMIAFTPFAREFDPSVKQLESLELQLIHWFTDWQWFSVSPLERGFDNKNSLGDDDSQKSLNCRYLISGSIHKSTDVIRITVQLVSLIENKTVWSENYILSENYTFEEESELCIKITAQASYALVGYEGKRCNQIELNERTADELFYTAYWLLMQNEKESTEKAIQLCNLGFEKDPFSILARYGIFHGEYQMVIEQWTQDINSKLEKLETLSKSSLQQNNKNAISHLMMGRFLYLKGDIDGTLSFAEKSVELNPCLAESAIFLAQMLAIANRKKEAIYYAQRALDFNPYLTNNGTYMAGISIMYYLLESYKESISWAQKSLYYRPDCLLSTIALICSFYLNSEKENAKIQSNKLLQYIPSFSIEKLAPMMKVLPLKKADLIIDVLSQCGIPYSIAK